VRILIFLSLWLPSSLWAATWVASIEPLAMVAREVLGEQVTVQTLLLPNQTPHFAAFTPAQLKQVRDARRVVWLGAGAEPHLEKMLARAADDSLALLSLPGVVRRHGADAAEHEHDGHAHAELDPHLWLSIENLVVLTNAIADAAIAEGHEASGVRDRQQRLTQALLQWQRQAQARLEPYRLVPWLSQHDPWGYFTESLGVAMPLRVSGSLQGSTSSRHFAELVTRIREQSVGCVVREPEAQKALLARLCPGCNTADLDPLARDRRYDSIEAFLDHLAAGFARCLSAATRAP